MDLHALGGGYYLRGLLLDIMLYFGEATIRAELLNKGCIVQGATVTTDLAFNVMGNLCNLKTYSLFGDRQNLVHRAHRTQSTANLTPAKDLRQQNLGTHTLV